MCDFRVDIYVPWYSVTNLSFRNRHVLINASSFQMKQKHNYFVRYNQKFIV